MGVNTTVWIKKKDLPALLCDLYSLSFLIRKAYCRWGAFLDNLDLDIGNDELTREELMYHLMTYEGELEDREGWADIVKDYDVLFLPDTKEYQGDDRIELFDYLSEILEREASKLEEELKNGRSKA